MGLSVIDLYEVMIKWIPLVAFFPVKHHYGIETANTILLFVTWLLVADTYFEVV